MNILKTGHRQRAQSTIEYLIIFTFVIVVGMILTLGSHKDSIRKTYFNMLEQEAAVMESATDVLDDRIGIGLVH
jgi:hypothetical protein